MDIYTVLLLVGMAVMSLAKNKGSSLVLEKTPSVVNPPFTKNITLRCSLHDMTVAPKNGVSDVTLMKDNITHVNSISIYKEIGPKTKEYIAAVATRAAARALSTGPSISVTGDVEGHSTDRGYLQVFWDDPSYDLNGTYVCKVSMLHGLVETMTYSVATTLTVKKPCLEDVVNQLHFLDQAYSRKVQTLNKKREDLEKDLNKTREELKSKTNELTKNNTALENALNKAKHIEMSDFNCVRTGSPASFNIKFSKPYDRAPRVYVTGVRQKYQFLVKSIFNTYTHSVTTTGFKLRCHINKGVFRDLMVSWISLPN